MAARWTFYTGFTLVFVFFSTLSLFQRFLVATGGLLGAEIYYAAISYVPIKPPKKAVSAIYFDPRLLVSIEDKTRIKCIYPKFNGCSTRISGKFIKDFEVLLGDLKAARGFRDNKSKMQNHLRNMIKLKLCCKCLVLTEVDKCVEKCVEKWSIEIQSKAFAKSIRAWDERFSSSEQGSVRNLQSQAANILPPALVGSTLQSAIPDIVHPDVPQTIVESAAMLGNVPSISNEQALPTRAVGPADGWSIGPYNPENETLHERIHKDLQKQEVDDGHIYVLRRDDDQEYYKVGFSARDPQERLAEHNKKCNATWEIVWKTDNPIKHAKRVERLIHIESGLRKTRYQENFCKTGAKSCTVQHHEIIKAPLTEVETCVKHWVHWMMSQKRYEEIPRASAGASPTNKQPVWKLTSYHRYLVIHNVTDEFCLRSDGETWVLTPEQRKSIRRRKSTSVTPTRPRLEDTRGTRSDGIKTGRRTQFDTSSNAEASTGARILSTYTGSRRKSTRWSDQHTEVHGSVSEDDPETSGDFHLEATKSLHTPRASVSPCTDADTIPAQEQATPTRPSKPVHVPVILVNGAQKYGCLCHHRSSSNNHCVACVTPDPDDELRNEDCASSDDDDDPYVSCESQNSMIS